ncbi:MAG: transglycosylase domain-containing protein, partial [Verrucomicrobiia bacterium]
MSMRGLGYYFWRLTIAGVIFVGILAVAAGVAAYLYLEPYYHKAQTYDLGKLDDYDVTTTFFDKDGNVIGRLFTEDRIVLRRDQIPDRMRDAILAVEDRRFYSHGGIDFQGLARAAWINLRLGRAAEGGSTVTQQLAKHLMGDFSRTIERKAVEAFLALRIEKAHSKDEILDYYLNRIYFGTGYFGLGAAAKGYFGKDAADLTIGECALLAGIVKSPNSSSPRNNLASARARRDASIRKMEAEGFISRAEAQMALRERIELVPRAPSGVQTYFVALAQAELVQVLGLGENDPIPGGLRVYTTQNTELQRQVEAVVEARMREIEGELKRVREVEAFENGSLQAAALVAEVGTGAVRVYLGGRNFLQTPFDRARMARRENGALLQPFLYALGFEKLGLHPASMINASFVDPETFGRSNEQGLGDPNRDLGRRFLTVQDALALSNRAAAARVARQLGVKNFQDWLARAGAPQARTAAGTFWELPPLSLLEVASLYQAMANGGEQVPLHAVVRVTNDQGIEVYQAESRRTSRRLMDELTARQMTLTLQSVVRDGTASFLRQNYSLPAPVVGMTGYSDGLRDAWFVGYTPALVGGVWVGFDQSTPIGNRALASRTALPIWGDMMQTVLKEDASGGSFEVPSALAKVEVDRRSGVIRGLGFLSPGPGNIFVYLKQRQLTAAQRASVEAAARVQQPEDWSDWLSTLYAAAADPGTTLEQMDRETAEPGEPGLIPHVAQLRLPGLRGDILTSDGQVLATMAQSQNLVLQWPPPEIARTDDEVVSYMRARIKRAEEWLGRPVEVNDNDIRALYRFQRFHPLTVAENLSDAQVDEFPTLPLVTDGFYLQGVPRRIYPFGSTFAHGLGYLLRKQGRSKRQHMAEEVMYDDYQGGAGLEEQYDADLRGKEGRVTLDTTQEGFTRAIIVNEQATAGANVRTTINAAAQHAAEAALSTVRAGAIVVLDVNNGDVVAMASQPTFDPNYFIPALRPDQWEALVKADKNPLLNRVIRQHHPPGSVFKVVTALASIRAGVFNPSRVVNCQGYFQVGNVRYN